MLVAVVQGEESGKRNHLEKWAQFSMYITIQEHKGTWLQLDTFLLQKIKKILLLMYCGVS